MKRGFYLVGIANAINVNPHTPMISDSNQPLLNLSIHESSDPEMLKRDAEEKTGSRPNDPDSGIEEPEADESDQEITPDYRRAERPLNVANPYAAALESGPTEI